MKNFHNCLFKIGSYTDESTGLTIKRQALKRTRELSWQNLIDLQQANNDLQLELIKSDSVPEAGEEDLLLLGNLGIKPRVKR